MAEKLRAIRWLGAFGAANDRKGVLHIDRPDDKDRPRRVVRPGEPIKDPKNLAVLGAARIQELVDEGQAEYLDALEKLGVDELLNRENVKDDSTPGELKAAEDAAIEASKKNTAAKALAENVKPDDSRVTGAGMNAAGYQTVSAPQSPAPEAPKAPTPPAADDLLGGPAGVL